MDPNSAEHERTRLRSATWVAAPVVVALVLSAACGRRSDVDAARYYSYLHQAVSASPDAGVAPRIPEAVHRLPNKAGQVEGVPEAGGVYRGRQPLTIALPPAGAEVVTYHQWAAMLLQRIGAPVCGNNVVAVVAWEAHEATAAGWNPLATTRPMPGATRFNGHGVRNYVSLEQGLDATELTLMEGWDRYGYGPIVRSLRSCARPMGTAEAVRASRWCLGCAAGRYPVALVPAVVAEFNRAYGPDG